MTEQEVIYEPADTQTFNFFGPPVIHRHVSPVARFGKDVKNIIANYKLIPVVLSAFTTERDIDELWLQGVTFSSLAYFTLGSILQVIVFGAPVVILVIVATVTAAVTFLHGLAWHRIQGPELQVYPPTLPEGHRPDQRWIYLNGIATGKTITRQNLQYLSQIFHNPVLAVNNRTYGFMGDLVECIIQRSFGFRTQETTIAYDFIKAYLEDEDIKTVILIAHSQGGILASHILDDLYCSVSRDCLAKLEVYTFGSAALQFNNPYTDNAKKSRVVPVIEHYCNERDMVTSWGALSSPDREEVIFAGKIFVHHGQTGHMLNQHYLKHMFTGPVSGWSHDNFQLKAVTRDSKVPDKFHVEHTPATTQAQKSVKSESKLWTYMG